MSRTDEVILNHTPHGVRRPVELVLRTVRDVLDDRVPGLAAEIAFFMLLSLPPLLLLGLGTVGYIGQADPGFAGQAADQLLGLAGNVLTDDTIATLRPVIDRLLSEGRADIASLGVLLTIFSASRALRAVVVALTIAYDLEENRPRWKQRLVGLGLTVVGVTLGMLAVPLLVLGPGLGRIVGEFVGLNPQVDQLWRIAYWPAAAVIVTVLVTSLYHFAAPWSTPWWRDLPGAMLAMVMWLLGSAGLRVYVAGSSIDDAVFAPFTGPLVLLLWMYVSAFAVLLGAEFNGEIEKMWPTRQPQQATSAGDRS